jgi:hypothetical protein
MSICEELKGCSWYDLCSQSTQIEVANIFNDCRDLTNEFPQFDESLETIFGDVRKLVVMDQEKAHEMTESIFHNADFVPGIGRVADMNVDVPHSSPKEHGYLPGGPTYIQFNTVPKLDIEGIFNDLEIFGELFDNITPDYSSSFSDALLASAEENKTKTYNPEYIRGGDSFADINKAKQNFLKYATPVLKGEVCVCGGGNGSELRNFSIERTGTHITFLEPSPALDDAREELSHLSVDFFPNDALSFFKSNPDKKFDFILSLNSLHFISEGDYNNQFESIKLITSHLSSSPSSRFFGVVPSLQGMVSTPFSNVSPVDSGLVSIDGSKATAFFGGNKFCEPYFNNNALVVPGYDVEVLHLTQFHTAGKNLLRMYVCFVIKPMEGLSDFVLSLQKKHQNSVSNKLKEIEFSICESGGVLIDEGRVNRVFGSSGCLVDVCGLSSEMVMGAYSKGSHLSKLNIMNLLFQGPYLFSEKIDGFPGMLKSNGKKNMLLYFDSKCVEIDFICPVKYIAQVEVSYVQNKLKIFFIELRNFKGKWVRSWRAALYAFHPSFLWIKDYYDLSEIHNLNLEQMQLGEGMVIHNVDSIVANPKFTMNCYYLKFNPTIDIRVASGVNEYFLDGTLHRERPDKDIGNGFLRVLSLLDDIGLVGVRLLMFLRVNSAYNIDNRDSVGMLLEDVCMYPVTTGNIQTDLLRNSMVERLWRGDGMDVTHVPEFSFMKSLDNVEVFEGNGFKAIFKTVIMSYLKFGGDNDKIVRELVDPSIVDEVSEDDLYDVALDLKRSLISSVLRQHKTHVHPNLPLPTVDDLIDKSGSEISRILRSLN